MYTIIVFVSDSCFTSSTNHEIVLSQSESFTKWHRQRYGTSIEDYVGSHPKQDKTLLDSAKKLPNYIKYRKHYRTGNIEQGLTKTFDRRPQSCSLHRRKITKLYQMLKRLSYG